MMKKRNILIVTVICILTVCLSLYIVGAFHQNLSTFEGHKTVICIPVYGQSLALGEEAIRVTDFDSLRIKNDGRIVTECFNYDFGYFDGQEWKQSVKRFVHYDKKSFELSVYGMAESLVNQLGNDTIICIFPEGAGMTSIIQIKKSTEPYEKFLHEIKKANQFAVNKGWDFYVPAICWMQGETDIADYTDCDYKSQLKEFCTSINQDIKKITHQKQDVHIICYQSNVVTRAESFNNLNYDCRETKVPNAIVDLLRNDSLFWASSPTYPYTFVNEALHIDGISQKRIGHLHAVSALKIIRGEEKNYGLIPLSAKSLENDAIVHFNVPCAPLSFDTISVNKITNYGFNVINQEGKDILSNVSIAGNDIILHCTESPIRCKVRYAVNGDAMKSGPLRGPRGNLRDSQGDRYQVRISEGIYPLHNWCYQFDIEID